MPPNNPRERMELFSAQSARGDHEAALATIEELIGEFTVQIPLHWYRARTLRTLQRDQDALEELQVLLKLKADFAPAWLMRAEIAADHNGGQYPEADLRQALKLDPGLARAHLLLSRWLTAQGRNADAEDALERALKVDPLQAQAYADRAGWHQRDAAQGFGDQGPEDPRIIVSGSGQRWSRPKLELARADLEHSLEIRDDAGVRLTLARVLHEMRDFDAALAAFDAVLFTIPNDDPRHEQVREMRAQSMRGDQAEFANLNPADYLTVKLPTLSVPALEEAPAVAGSAAVQSLSLEEAKARFGGDDEDSARALAIAFDLYQLAHPAEPRFERTELSRYPKYQQEYALATAKALGAQAFRLVGDFDAVHRSAQLSPVLTRIYVSNDGVSCATSCCSEPKFGSAWSRLWMKLTGKWKRIAVTDFETAFDDGSFLITSNAASAQPFVHKGRIERVQLHTETTPAAIYSRHRARIERYRRDHPHATAERVDTDPRIFELHRRVSSAKSEYRLAIGYVDDNELKHLLGEDYDFLAQPVRDKLAQLIAASAG